MISYERFKELCESIGLKETVLTEGFKFFIFSFEDYSKECAVYNTHWGMRVLSILDESYIVPWELEESALIPRLENLKQEIKQFKMNYKLENMKEDFV